MMRCKRLSVLVVVLVALLLSASSVTAQEPTPRVSAPNVPPYANPACTGAGANLIECVVVGVDRHVWRMNYDSAGWHYWSDLDAPPTGSDTMGGVSIVAHGSTILDVYVVGKDGNLWVRQRVVGYWQSWSSLARPTGVLVFELACTGSQAGARTDCFVRGGDNHLWQKTYIPWLWGSWTDLGALPTTSISLGGVAASTYNDAGPSLLVYVTGSDGHAWRNFYQGSVWSGWIDDGQPTSVNLTTASCYSWGDGRADCAFVGSDTNVWYSYYDGSWTHGGQQYFNRGHSAAPGIREAGGVGISSWGVANTIVMFAVGTDGNLYREYTSSFGSTNGGSNWNGWFNDGRPPEYRISLPLVIR